MGAELYFHTTPYIDDPNAALVALQTAMLDALDLRQMVASNLASSEQAFHDTPEGDEYGLHDHYKAELERARSIASEPIPTGFDGRIDLVRRLHADTGQGIGNILDVDGVVGDGGAGPSAARPLMPVELIDKFGSDCLLSADADQLAGNANVWLGRGECVCFPLYSATDDDAPAEWCFVGNTVD